MSERLKNNVETIEKRKQAKAIKTLRAKLQLSTLASVIQRGSGDPTYELKLVDGSFIVLGNAYEIHQQAKVRARLFVAKVRMPRFDARDWDEVLDCICAAAEYVEMYTEAEELRNYVVGYVRGHLHARFDGMSILDGVSNLDATLEDYSGNEERLRDYYAGKRYKGFVSDNRIYLHLGNFTSHVNVYRAGRYSEREMSQMLSRSGFEYKQKTVRYDSTSGERKSMNVGRFWRSPKDYLDESEPEDSM